MSPSHKRQRKAPPEANRRGFGFILDRISSISQIINDERPQAQMQDSEVSQNSVGLQKILGSISKKSHRWFMSEYFYSFVDKPFFQENELIETLDVAGLPKVLQRSEWALVRQSLASQVGSTSSPGRKQRLFSR